MSSSRSAERLEKKLQSALRECQKRPENKRCADCKERLPQWVVSDFNTFVCTACSGIHREFSHRVKSISLAKFSEEEVASVKAGGNEISNDLYMARYRPEHDIPEPEGGRADKHREFIRTKYVDRRWYATSEDLEKDVEREKEREVARAKRDAERVKKDSGSSAGASKRLERASMGSAGRGRKANADRGLRKVDPPKAKRLSSSPTAGAAVKPPRVPKQPVDLLDFLSDGLPSAPKPAQVPPQAQAPPEAHQWAAFDGGANPAGAIAPPPLTGGTPGFAPWAAFGDAPAAPQQPQQQATGVAFQDGSTTQAHPTPGASFPALKFNATFPPADLGVYQQPQPQPPHPRTVFASPVTPGGGLLGMPPTAIRPHPSPSPNGVQTQPQPQPGFVQPGVGFPMSRARMSAPGTPGQQPQQVGGFLSGSQGVPDAAGGGFVASFEGLSLSQAAGGGVDQHGGQGVPSQGHQRSISQQGASFPQGTGQPQVSYHPNVAQQQQQQHPRSAFFSEGMTSQQMQMQMPPQHPSQQGFPAFGQQPQFHQPVVGQPQYPQPQQTQHQHQQVPQHLSHYPQQPQHFQQQQQQAVAGIGRGPSAPVLSPRPADVDPFAELADGGNNGHGATGNLSARDQRFEKGDEVLYVRGSDPPLEGTVQKVHMEEYPPYYTVLISITGREKNTDAAHLRYKNGEKRGIQNGGMPQQGQQPAGPDAFASLGVGAWGRAAAGAPVYSQAEPLQAQTAQQVGPHPVTKFSQPMQVQGKGVPLSAGVGLDGDVGGGGNPFGGVEPAGMPTVTVTAVAGEQAGGNPFDMF